MKIYYLKINTKNWNDKLRHIIKCHFYLRIKDKPKNKERYYKCKGQTHKEIIR